MKKTFLRLGLGFLEDQYCLEVLESQVDLISQVGQRCLEIPTKGMWYEIQDEVPILKLALKIYIKTESIHNIPHTADL